MGILKGKVKFFDAEKGYGIVCNLENMLDEYKINASNIVGYDFPKRGDVVSFKGTENIKTNKKYALELKIEESAAIESGSLSIAQGNKKGDFVLDSSVDIEDIKRQANPNDPRTKCPHCGCIAIHKIYYNGEKKCIKCNEWIIKEEVAPVVWMFIVIIISFILISLLD